MYIKKIKINDLSEDEQKAQRVGSLEKTAKCPDGNTVKCYTTKNDWQVIY